MYPKDFLWGSSTSSHQVEGYCTNNNWSEFESAVDDSGRPKILGGQRSGPACDQWNRYPADIRLMKDLGLNAYRFSVEWSKIEPAEGTFDEAVLDHYEAVIDSLLVNRIVPMVTLHHFTNPIWFERKGGFLHDDAPRMFARFAEHVVTRLQTKVPFWITINEPSVYAINGYATGEFPPGRKNYDEAIRVLGNLLRAHSDAYGSIKSINPALQVGLAVNIFIFEPYQRWNPLDIAAAYFTHRGLNNATLRFLTEGVFEATFPGFVSTSFSTGRGGTFDFIGLNYYTRFLIHLNPLSKNPVSHRTRETSTDQLTDMGWEIYPDGLARALRLIHSFTARPIYITENGIADEKDSKRGAFIRDHIAVIDRAITEGIDVRGYFYWSLLDNFEWAFGYARRFGLYSVDFTTQKRTLREGSMTLRDIIRARTLER